MEVVRESFFKGMISELSIERQNRISDVKTERRHFQPRMQTVQRHIDKRKLGTFSMAKQIVRKRWGEGKLAR